MRVNWRRTMPAVNGKHLATGFSGRFAGSVCASSVAGCAGASLAAAPAAGCRAGFVGNCVVLWIERSQPDVPTQLITRFAADHGW